MLINVTRLRSIVQETYRKLRTVDLTPKEDVRDKITGSAARGREAQEGDLQDQIDELRGTPEFEDVDAFMAMKLDNDELTYDFVELQALARNLTAQRTGNSAISTPGQQDLNAVRGALEGEMGFKYLPRQPTKDVRGATSNQHGTHPFAGAGGGGSGFGDGGFTGMGKGPGAIGGKYDWKPDDPKNLPMGSKRRKI